VYYDDGDVADDVFGFKNETTSSVSQIGPISVPEK